MATNTHTQSETGGYGFGKTTLSVLLATVLIGINVAVMYAVAPTALADTVIWMYQGAPFSPWLGLIAMSGLLSVGRLVSYKSLGFDPVDPEDTVFVGDVNLETAFIGLVATQLAFGLFGGAALSIVSPSARMIVLAISISITAVLTILIGAVEFLTSNDIAPYGYKIHSFGMKIGIGLFAVSWLASEIGLSFAGILYMVTFAMFVIGWIGDMIHEISVLTDDDRSVAINAFGLYAAVTGVLVHIIWIVARAWAQSQE